jgi:hypothetical protein
VLQDGVFLASVDANRPSVVLLKVSYDPRWTVTVDGKPAKATMMAPSLVGVEVPAGKHVVRFRYEPYGAYPILLAIGAIALLVLALVPRRAAIGRRLGKVRRGRAPVAEGPHPASVDRAPRQWMRRPRNAEGPSTRP